MTRKKNVKRIKVSRRLKKILKRMINSRRCPQGLALRIKIILLSIKHDIPIVVEILGISPPTVRKWINRWVNNLQKLIKAAAKGKKNENWLKT